MMIRRLSIEELTYELPDARIAQHPLAERDSSKLLVHRNGHITDRIFKDLPDELPGNALLVLNDTRVVHARITFKRATGAVIECMVLTPENGRVIEHALNDQRTSRWWCMLGNAKRWKGEELTLEKDGHRLSITRIDQLHGEHLLEFRWENDEAFNYGTVPYRFHCICGAPKMMMTGVTIRLSNAPVRCCPYGQFAFHTRSAGRIERQRRGRATQTCMLGQVLFSR